MKYKVGDRVKFLNDVGSGIIAGIVDKNTALVSIEDGFDVPVLLKDLVLEGGNYIEEEAPTKSVQSRERVSGKESEVAPLIEADQIEDEEVVLAFLPEDNSSEFESYLINSSSYYLDYLITREQQGEQLLYHRGELEPGIKILLRNYHPGQLLGEEVFRIQIIFFNNGPFRYIHPVDMMLKFKFSDMYEVARRVENDYFHEKAILHTLHSWRKKPESKMEIDPEELKKAMLTKKDEIIKKSPEKKVEEVNEVDLHIEILVDDHRNMDNGQIVEIQLARFRTALDSAILHKSKRVIFIHGVGNGKLKYELRKILDTEYRKIRYQDASFKEYGYGATLVIL